MESNSEILSRLKFIAKINKGEKVNTKYLYVQPVGFITGIIRTLYNQDNRGNMMNFIQSTVNRAFEILHTYDHSKKSSDKIMCKNLIQDLKQSKQGLVNLKDTYVLDVKFCCDMDTLLQHIDAQISNIENKFSPLNKRNKND